LFCHFGIPKWRCGGDFRQSWCLKSAACLTFAVFPVFDNVSGVVVDQNGAVENWQQLLKAHGLSWGIFGGLGVKCFRPPVNPA